MSIQSNFPAISPTLNLSFALTKALDPRITFTRASTATYYGTQTAKAEENLLQQSQTLTTGVWGSTNATVTADTTTAPDGTTTADTVTDDTTAQAHICAQVVTMITSAVYTLSFFLKASTNNFAIVTLSSSTAQNYISAIVDLSTGAITETSTGTSATFTSSSISSFGNGWYRVAITGSCTAGFTRSEMGLALAATGNTFATNGRTTYTGTGTSVFAWGAQLEQRSAATAYTATTTQPITNYIPVLQTAASGVARFDHNPTTFESLGLLIEESRTNLILQSEDLDTTWAETRATLSLNSVVAPTGALTADRLIASTDNNTHFTSQTFTGTAASHTFSVYAKASGLNHVALRLFNGTSQVGLAYYNLSTGATGTVTAGTAAITSVGNGYYRCSLTATLAASASCTSDIQLANADNSNSFIGNAFDGVTLWGTQVELGAFPTSYIPTVASQVTRSADAASMTGTNFSSWYNQSAGTIYSEANTFDASVIRVAVGINDGTTPNRILSTHGASPKGFVAVNGITQMSQGVSPVVFSNNTFSKMSVAYAVNNGNAAANGSIGTLDTAMTIPVVTQLQIGSQTGSATQTLNGTIKKIAYYPLRVTDAQLQALTS